MSNSGLVSYTKLSPNYTQRKGTTIDTITIHTMAGNCSIEACGELFADPKRQASSNYGIGSDGRIALYVEECNRAWTSSNRANDMRAVTIEVASINTTDFKPSDAAYTSLIKLCADICKRNNIKELKWRADSNLIGRPELQNMTVHRWFNTKKSCPGDWLYRHMGNIASEVNVILHANSVIKPDEVADEAKDMYVFLSSKDVSDYFIFGLMGNIFAESGIKANNLQNSYERKFSMTDEEYTAAVDNGTYKNFTGDKAGYGYAQWTFWTRKGELWNYARNTARSIGNPAMQREFLWNELTTTYKGVYDKLLKASSIREASDIVLTQFEKPADQSEAIKVKRAKFGEELYKKYAEKSEENKDEIKVPFLVRVTANGLNIRKLPDPNSDKVKTITDHGVYTIVEVSYYKGVMWGKLKSGLGWIRIDNYTERL